MAGDGIVEAPSPCQRLFEAVSEAVSNHAGEEGQSLRDGCKFAVARGDSQPDKEILRRILSWAVHNDNSSLVAEVVRLDATVSCTQDFHPNSGYSLLLSAAYYGKENIVGWLLAASAGGEGFQGRSVALQLACAMGRVGVITALLADGTHPSPSASANDSESRKPSAFEMATKRGYVGVMRFILQRYARGASAECDHSAREIDNALRKVMRSPNNTFDVIDFLVNEAGADVHARNDRGDTLLHQAVIFGGTPETIAALFRHGADDGALDNRGYPPLHLASMLGKKTAIAALAAAGTDINRRNSKLGMTALDWAAFLGNVDVLKILVETGADVRGSGPRGDSPLHFAVKCKSVGASEASCEAINALLLHGAEVDAADMKGETPLVIAVRMGKLAWVNALVAGGADVNRRNEVNDEAPLDVAAFIGNLGVLKALLGYGSRAKSVNSVGATALHHVAPFEAANLVHALVDAGADVSAEDANGMGPIHYASVSGSPTAIMALTQRGADSEARTKNGITPLQLAAECGEVSAIDALAAAGADINLRTRTMDTSALDFAANAGEVDAMNALIRHGANVRAGNASGYTALHFMEDVNHAASIDFLVGAGADVNVETEQGFTPLHIASFLGFSGAVGSLLKHGADKDFTSSTGVAPIHLAAEHGRLPVLNALVEAGANVWRRTQDHMSALDLAAGSGHMDVLKALIRHGVDVNDSDAKGRSPLYEAAARNRVAAIRALVDAGADIHGLAQEWTPLDASCIVGAADAITTLAELGADLTRTSGNDLIPLELAVNGDHLDAVNALLAAGVDPNQEPGGKRVLESAILSMRSDIVATLLLHGADVNKEVAGDMTGLIVAVENEDAGVVNVLLGAGADVNNGVSVDGMSALHYACTLRSTEIMLALLSHGASIGARDENGMSPLHHAAYSCVHMDSGTDRVGVLLRAGADETARDCDGLTPAEFVRSTFFDETYQDSLAAVTVALERAPADRAWRRRGMVLLCRSFVEGKAKKPEPLVETGAQEEGSGNFGGLMSKLFALEEEGLFRTVVGFL